MRVVEGGNFAYTRGVAYPIVVSEDTEYRGSNFAQAAPHTTIFLVAMDVRVRFVECNLVNVTVPDGAEIVGGNLAHIVPTETGNPERPIINLLHECEKCSSAVMELRDGIESSDLPKDETGRILHHALKDRFRARREFEMLAESDIFDIQTENDAALVRWSK